MGICHGQNGWIYIGTDNNCLYAFDTALNYRWRTRLNGSKVWCAHPVYSPDGTVYVETPDYLSAVDADGNLVWGREVQGVGGHTPVVDTGRGRIYCVAENLEIVALNSVGKELWRTGHCTIGLDRPLIAGDGTIVCPDRLDGVITAVTPEGKTRWQVTTTAPRGMFNDWWWVALGADDAVYYAEEDETGRCSLTVCNIDGTRRWSRVMPCTVDCPLVLSDGRIIVTKGHGYESNPVNNILYRYVIPNTNQLHMQVAILDRQGRAIGRIAPEYELITERPLLTSSNELLLIDEHGVLHVYQL